MDNHAENTLQTAAPPSEIEQLCERWLQQQSLLLHGACAGLVLTASASGEGIPQLTPTAIWPATFDDSPTLEQLIEVVENTFQEGCGLLAPKGQGDPEGHTRYILALPLTYQGEALAAVAFVVASNDENQLSDMMQQLEWGTGNLRAQLGELRLINDSETDQQRRAATELLAAVTAQPSFDSAGATYVIELTQLLAADRASLGYVRDHKARLRFMSHSAQFSKQMNLTRAIESAMVEALDQRQAICFPEEAANPLLLHREQEALTVVGKTDAVMSIPVFRAERCLAVITVERRGQAFSEREVRLCEALSLIAASVLEDKRLNDRWLVVKAWDALLEQLRRLLGPRYVLRKLGALLVTACFLFFSLYKTDYRLAADVVLEGSVQRVIAAPFDGYIKIAAKQAGDHSAERELIAALDERDLELQRYKWKSELAQRRTQLEDALGSRDRARIRVLTAQVEQAQAELDLVDGQLARVELRAPFDGILVSGDLSQRLGSAVSKGEELFRIAPLDAYRVIMQVPEDRIGDLSLGQTGAVVLFALPQLDLGVTLTRITPLTESRDGATFFEVEGLLDRSEDALRPGMIGIAKIQIDRRLLISIWTRGLREWLQLRWWAFWG